MSLNIDLNASTVKYKQNNAENASGIAVSYGYREVRDFEI
jgi:hypothetical protein